MKRRLQYFAAALLLVIFMISGCSVGTQQGADKNVYEKNVGSDENARGQEDEGQESDDRIKEDGEYTSKDEVAAYLYEFGTLPSNFITKKEAKKLGWVSSEGNLGEAAPGKSIGGDKFGNYEGQLPEKDGRKYFECDINSDGGYRGAERIIYSNDGLIYYTGNHYKKFELLYGEE